MQVRLYYPVNPLSAIRMTDDNELLDISAAAQFLNVSETSLRRWTNAGALPCLRVGKRRERRFRRADLIAFMEDQPSGPIGANGSAPQLPAGDAAKLIPGSHLCGLFADDLGRVTLSVRFILDGLQEGSMVYVVASERSLKTVRGYLKQRRPSLERDISDGKLMFCEYRKDPRAQIRDFQKQLSKAAAAGIQSFRVFGDVWEMRKKTTPESFAGYEATYEQMVARRYPVVTLCAYDTRRFSGVGVLDALKAHRDTFRYPLERALA